MSHGAEALLLKWECRPAFHVTRELRRSAKGMVMSAPHPGFPR